MRAAAKTATENPILPILGVIISILALADGALHFSLDYVMFHGRIWGSFRPSGPPPGGSGGLPTSPGFGGPPPGAGVPGGHAGPPPGPHFSLPLPNNELFVLNAVGYVVLVLVFWLGQSLLGWWRWLIDAAIAIYAGLSIWFWFEFGAPNPDNLGYASKAIEAALIVCLAIHAWYVTVGPGARPRQAIDVRKRQPVR